MPKNCTSEREEGKMLEVLKARFEQNAHNYPEANWAEIAKKLQKSPQKMWALHQMEKTDGEPAFIGMDENTKEYIFCDCSKESPFARRSLCYDNAALEKRKKDKPQGSAAGLAAEMGIELLSEHQYKKLQEFCQCDLKTSSWVLTPKDIRDLGGALFCDRRYGKVFTYHNGAESYYSSRGFRGVLKV